MARAAASSTELPRIASRANPQFRELRALSTSAAERRRLQRTVLDGPHLVTAYLERARPALVAVSDSGCVDPEIGALLARAGSAPKLRFADALFEQLAPVQTPTGIVAVIDIPRPAPGPLGDCVVVLDNIQDPGNVGAIIRSAAAAGADAVLLSHGCADAWAPRTLRAAMGAHFALQVRAPCDVEQALRNFDGQVIATLGAGGPSLYRTSLNGKIALLLGSEGAGLRPSLQAMAHASVSIPLARGVESLNVAAAAAVILFERARQLAAADRSRPQGGTRRRG